MKKLCRTTIVLLLCGFFTSVASAQTSRSLQRTTVTSVTMVIDSIDTASEAELVETLITAHPEVNNFDIKLHKCNFTFAEGGLTVYDFLNELKSAGYVATVKDLQAHQTYTYVPEENCMAKDVPTADLKEADFVRSFEEKGADRKPIREDQ